MFLESIKFYEQVEVLLIFNILMNFLKLTYLVFLKERGNEHVQNKQYCRYFE